MVHSSLSAIGYFQEGVETIIEELIKSVGNNGNLLMMSGTNSFSKTKFFDIKNTPSETGLLTELFRQRQDVVRSPVPMESYVAWGKDKYDFTRAYNSYLEGSSPLRKLLDLNGKIILFGVPYSKCTLYHLSEERYKLKYNFYKKFEGVMIDENGIRKSCFQEYFVRKDLTTKKNVNWVGEKMEKNGLVVNYKLGLGYVKIFQAQDFDNHCMNALEKDEKSFLKHFNRR